MPVSDAEVEAPVKYLLNTNSSNREMAEEEGKKIFLFRLGQTTTSS